MAIAAADFAFVEEAWLGSRVKMRIFNWTGPASYASGGEALTTAIGKALGFNEIHAFQCAGLVKASDGTSVGVRFDHNSTAGTTHGKIRVAAGGVAAHAHDFLVKGGTAAAGTDALNIKTVIIGKESATDATSLAADTATKGGVMAVAAGTTTAELAATTNLSTYTGRVVIFGC